MTVRSRLGHRDSIAGLETVDTNYVRMNASEFASVNLDPKKYSAIFVASNGGGLLTQVELDALNARSSDIRQYLNGGGGLVALAESNLGAHLTPDGGHFDFLPVSVSPSAGAHSSVGTTVTTFGAGLGLADSDVNCNYSHQFFGETGGMHIVDTYVHGEIMSLAYRGFFGPDRIVTEEDDGKVHICHFTGNTADPWEMISVPPSAVASHFPGHDDVFPDEFGNCPGSGRNYLPR